MEEEVKRGRPAKSNAEIKSSSLLTALTGTTIRSIVNAANAERIKREDIVSLLKEGNQFVLLYYK